MPTQPENTIYNSEESSKNEEVSKDNAKTDKVEKKGGKSRHPIADAIDTFLHRARDIEEAVDFIIPLARARKMDQLNEFQTEMHKVGQLLGSTNESATVEAKKEMSIRIPDLVRLIQSDLPTTLQISLFLGLFSAYDAFTGELLAAIYLKKPELFKMVNKEIPVSDILQYNSFEELQEAILQDEIEVFRRKGYVEQFNYIKNSFGVDVSKIERWPNFVECGQRRNLMTHCSGKVSSQYLQACKKAGYKSKRSVDIGAQLKLNRKYSLASCELMMEIALTFGQTLWRKLFKDEIQRADAHLKEVISDSLQIEKWERACIFGEFATNQKKVSSDKERRLFIIYYATALKFDGRQEKAVALLAKEDWTATISDLKLAETTLLDKFDDAAEIMKKIGTKGDIINENSYHIWPPFRQFRETPEFIRAYEKVYGHPFEIKLKEAAAEIKLAKANIESEVSENEQNPDSPDDVRIISTHEPKRDAKLLG